MIRTPHGVPMALSQVDLPLTLPANHTHVPLYLPFVHPLTQEMPGSHVQWYQLTFSLLTMDVSDQ